MITLKQEYEIKTGDKYVDTADWYDRFMDWLEQNITNLRVREWAIRERCIVLRLDVQHENETMFKCTGSRSVGYTHVIETLDAIFGISDSQPPFKKANTTNNE
jgi:hypothetical protein